MNYLDLFSGIGGFALGAYWAGWRFDEHYFSEIDEYAIKIYRQRFPDAIPCGDITGMDISSLPSGEWIITGGFPCQDISIAGQGKGIEGARSGLWFEMWRIIRDLRPRYVIAENVGAITFRGLDRVLSSLAEIGYDAEWQDIRASDVGAPHRRERIWIVAYPQCIGSGKESWSQFSADNINYDGEAQRARQDVADSDRPRSQRRNGEELRKCTRKWVVGSSNTQGIGSSWLIEPNVGRVAHGIPSRVDRLKCLGNSIVPQIAEMIIHESS